jgi:hypothetical protein
MHLKKLQTLNDILKTIIESGNTDTRALDQMEGDGQTLNGEMPENMDVEEKESAKL